MPQLPQIWKQGRDQLVAARAELSDASRTLSSVSFLLGQIPDAYASLESIADNGTEEELTAALASAQPIILALRQQLAAFAPQLAALASRIETAAPILAEIAPDPVEPEQEPEGDQ